MVLNKSDTNLTSKLDAISELIPIETTDNNGTGTLANPYEVKVNTIGGVTQLLEWLIANCEDYHRSQEIIDKDGVKIYQICAILNSTQRASSNTKQKIYIKVAVDNTNDDVIDYLNDIEDDSQENNQNLQNVFNEIGKDVISVENGNGSIDNPLILSVKPVNTTQLNTFLTKLNDLSPNVVDITKDNTNTQYKLEINNINTFVNRMSNAKLLDKTNYVTIKVDNKQTDLIKSLNRFSKTINSNIVIPSIVKFKDVSDKFWAKSNIENFASMGIINGYTDGSFKPNDSITRAEFVKIVNNIFGYKDAGYVTFTDVKKSDWFYNDVAIAVKRGYINGKSATTFAPNDKITRQEVAKILTTIMKNSKTELDRLNSFSDGYKTDDWAKPYIEGAIQAGYLTGDNEGKLNPTNNMTRAEAVTILSRLKK